MIGLFKRINFFKGLFTTAEDWQQEQRYHIEKRKLHHRGVHTPGVVAGIASDLKVTVTDDGRIQVAPGYAVDSEGRDLYLTDPIQLEDIPHSQEGDLYVYIQYAEEATDSRENPANGNYRGHAFILERPIVKCTHNALDNEKQIELARIKWEAGRRITPAQIDRSHVKYAGTKGAGSLVRAGEVDLTPTKGPSFSREDQKILVEIFSSEVRAVGVLYVANVFPIEVGDAADAGIHWRIESSMTNKREVRYYLFMKNFGTESARVHYEVYRLNLGPVIYGSIGPATPS